MKKQNEISKWKMPCGSGSNTRIKTGNGIYYEGYYVSKQGIPVTYMMEPYQGRNYQPFISLSAYINGYRYSKTLNKNFSVTTGMNRICLNFIKECQELSKH